jgi:hypothetical protein
MGNEACVTPRPPFGVAALNGVKRIPDKEIVNDYVPGAVKRNPVSVIDEPVVSDRTVVRLIRPETHVTLDGVPALVIVKIIVLVHGVVAFCVNAVILVRGGLSVSVNLVILNSGKRTDMIDPVSGVIRDPRSLNGKMVTGGRIRGSDTRLNKLLPVKREVSNF